MQFESKYFDSKELKIKTYNYKNERSFDLNKTINAKETRHMFFFCLKRARITERHHSKEEENESLAKILP